jgi:hypothetical protein
MLDVATDPSPNTSQTDSTSCAVAKRLGAISGVVSSLDVTGIRSREDATRALYVLELANKCIRVILREVHGTFAKNALIDQSDRLLDLIDVARSKLVSLRLV